jgi:hypothetical protein
MHVKTSGHACFGTNATLSFAAKQSALMIEQHQLVMTHSHVTSLLLTPDKATVIRSVNESCHRAPAWPGECASLPTG